MSVFKPTKLSTRIPNPESRAPKPESSMVGRPKKFDEQQALAAALEVFWKRGYEAASCEELLEAMGINSGSMYSTFGDKKALYEQAFELYANDVFFRTQEILNGPGSPLENVRTWVRGWQEFQEEHECKGCLVSHTIIEFGSSENPVGQRARKLIADMQAMLQEKLQDAQDLGELPEGHQPADLATFFVNTAHGMTVVARSGTGERDIPGIIRTMLVLLGENSANKIKPMKQPTIDFISSN